MELTDTRQGYQPAPYQPDPDETIECPQCGKMNDPHARYCDQCGYELAGSEDVESSSASAGETRWDGSASRYSDSEYAKACVLDRADCMDASKMTAKARYSLPVANPGSSWSQNPDKGGVAAAAQRLGAVSAGAACKEAARKRLSRCYAKLKMDKPDVVAGAARPSELRYAVTPLTHVDVRDPSGTGDDCYTMSGYAAVYNQATTLLDSRFLQVTEEVDRHAFDDLLTEQRLAEPGGVVHFNFGHDMNRAVAATDVPGSQPGSLRLSSDEYGLRFLAKVSRDDPDGVAMAVKMRDGVLRQASFAFTVAEDEFEYTEAGKDSPARDHRLIRRVGHLYDVCAVAQGAYPQTVSGLRSYARALGQPEVSGSLVTAGELEHEGGRPRQPEEAEASSGGVSAVSPRPETAPGGGGGEEWNAKRRSAFLKQLETERSKLNACRQ